VDEMTRGTDERSPLGRELRSTLAALDELGPAYEHELTTALRVRLRELDAAAPARRDRVRRLPVAAVAAAVAVALISTTALVGHSAGAHASASAWKLHREAVAGAQIVVPVQPPPPAPPIPPVKR